MPKAEYEEKFIVINLKHLWALDNSYSKKGSVTCPCKSVLEFDRALSKLNKTMEKRIGINLRKKKYFVCNQDEPYAQKVIDTILEGESEKT